MIWRHLGWRRKATPHDSEQRLAAAYKDIFKRQDEAVELVLADLAAHCGFYQVSPQGTPPDALMYQEGMRAAFGRLFHFLSLTDSQMQALEQAARAEASVLFNEE